MARHLCAARGSALESGQYAQKLVAILYADVAGYSPQVKNIAQPVKVYHARPRRTRTRGLSVNRIMAEGKLASLQGSNFLHALSAQARLQEFDELKREIA